MDSGIPTDFIELANGGLIPQLGFGTYKIDPADAYQAVLNALETGYRHIDTAQMYGNEAEVGAAIADSGIDRREIFVTSKLNNPFHEPEAARKAFAQTLADLQLDQIDLFLIHWPMAASTDYVATWCTLLEFQADGRARDVGVSNFQPHHLEAIIDATGVAPALNQVEIHPYLAQRDLVRFDAERGIATASWSPLGRGALLEDATVLEVADETNQTPSQVVIRWHLQRGLVVTPKTVNRERMEENAQVFDFVLQPEHMARLDALDRDERVGSHPDVVELGNR